MIYKVEALNSQEVLLLGQRGEHLANTIQIDVAAWQAEWPNASFSIVATRPDEDIPYSVETMLSGNVLLWQVTKIDTALCGMGRMEIHAVEDEKIKKTVTICTKVNACIGTVKGDMPDLPSSSGSKVDVNQGVENAGKYLGVGEDGKVCPVDAPKSEVWVFTLVDGSTVEKTVSIA